MSDILFYDATGCQYIEVTKMENAKGENSIKHLSLYKYGYFKPCYTIQKVAPKESLWHIMMIMIYYLL